MSNGDVLPPNFPPPPPPPLGGAPTRTGPAWEQPGDAVQRFINTVRPVLLEPKAAFATMRREGGLVPPLIYAIIGGAVGMIAAILYQSLFGGFGQFGGRGAHLGGGTIVALLIFLPIGLFLSSGILHLLLVLVGGARYAFEATFRTVAYTLGSTMLVNIVPICGGLVGSIWATVVLIIGLAEVHETTTGKSAAAVLLPMVVCCGLAALFWAAVAALIFGAAAGNLR